MSTPPLVPKTQAPGYSVDGHQISAPPIAPGLYVTSTPIGNLADVTLRALATLAAAELILCEDTRVTSRLLQRYNITATLKPYHDHNAARLRPGILAKLAGGARIALVSDAGTPLVSDPGYKLVRQAIEAGHAVHVVPGVSAPLTALALSGLPSDRFQFTGFLPSRQGQRRSALAELKHIRATLIFFETGQRIEAALRDIAEVLGDRRICIARELTKLHEQFLRGRVSDILPGIAGQGRLKGEITLVVAPPEESSSLTSDAEVSAALAAALTDLPPGKAAAEVAKRYGRRKNDLYAQALLMRKDPGGTKS